MQKVPRAEISAGIVLAMHLKEEASVVCITDCIALYKACGKGEVYATKHTTNKDMYIELFALIRSKKLKLLIDWMPSHLDEQPDKPKPSWVNADHIAGNSHVDTLAIVAAPAK